MRYFSTLIFALFLLLGCRHKTKEIKSSQMIINDKHTKQAVQKITEKFPETDLENIWRGVRHAASLWRQTDGQQDEFITFCVENYIGNCNEKQAVFVKVSQYFESIFGHFDKMTLDLKSNVDLQTGILHPVDHMFSAYSAGAHLFNDFYNNKIAFLVALNFPYYSTEEKNDFGRNWSELEWAYARLGDVFSSRIPPELIQKSAAISAESDAYIAEYNIYMGKLSGQEWRITFP